MKKHKKGQEKGRNIQMAVKLTAIIMVGAAFLFGLCFLLLEREWTDGIGAVVPAGSNSVSQNAYYAELTAPERMEAVEQAKRLAAAYDYDGAIALIREIEGYETDMELQAQINIYELTKASCVPVDINEVTHVFYHTLVVDPKRAFANQETNFQAVGNNQWMTTVDEFKKITQEMYDRGYVLVGLHDLIEVSNDENGNTVYQPATIMLPPGKKAYVLSQDDLCYYHSYDNYGYAAKLILDESGKPVCEYIQEDGALVTGAYDVVPILDAFIEEHPDASYRGAKGTIALTGYNGILGYRTDNSYLDIDGDISHAKKNWLKAHPDFDIEKERAEAKKVASAMKEEGWEFASHTWGHIKIGEVDLARLMSDTQKWRENVEPLVGKTDTIIFAHGQDLGKWGNYDETNEMYRYLREQDYSIFCNVDAGMYRTWFGKDYLRQGRRNLDGFRIYYNAIGEQDNVSDLFDAAKIIDPLRPPVPPLK
ncbi:MAG: polysaccharide deacetylase [Roseburia sp.]|nr:polysaccharide deacetylase [Roseburia sp.]MCM1278413.1 polysaccharide deacetylase [Robinsoniella sp.]